jgi:hypothetical protein
MTDVVVYIWIRSKGIESIKYVKSHVSAQVINIILSAIAIRNPGLPKIKQLIE